MKKIAILLLSFGLAGCVQDPYTGEQKISKTAIGSGVGALAGATVGLITGDSAKERRKHALIGAGVGAVGGGGIGYYMDNQEKKLRQQLQSSGVSVTRNGDDIILNMPSNITFDTSASGVKSDFYAVLNSVVSVIKEFEKTAVDISGHTDSTGAASYNQELSQQRANSVGAYFTSQGVIPERIVATGYGESNPIAPNNTRNGRARNRRVEIKLSPIVR